MSQRDLSFQVDPVFSFSCWLPLESSSCILAPLGYHPDCWSFIGVSVLKHELSLTGIWAWSAAAFSLDAPVFLIWSIIGSLKYMFRELSRRWDFCPMISCVPSRTCDLNPFSISAYHLFAWKPCCLSYLAPILNFSVWIASCFRLRPSFLVALCLLHSEVLSSNL